MRDDILVVTAKRAKGDDGYRIFSVRLKEQLVNRVDDISRRTGRSRNELIGLLLDYALDHCELEREEELSPR